jgi:hypothetical protein
MLGTYLTSMWGTMLTQHHMETSGSFCSFGTSQTVKQLQLGGGSCNGKWMDGKMQNNINNMQSCNRNNKPRFRVRKDFLREATLDRLKDK